jgi:simple sugar transport system permease protein
VLIAFGIIALLIFVLGYNPLQAFSTIIFVPLGSVYGIMETIKKFIPLLLTGFAFAVPLKARLFNIGGWGQLLAGAIAAVVTALALENIGLPSVVFVPLLLLMGLIGGALWSVVPATFVAFFRINEVVSTIMMNFIAVYLVKYVTAAQPWTEPFAGNPMTRAIPNEARLLLFGVGPYAELIVGALVVVVIYVFMNKTIMGYEIKATGANRVAARVFGINDKRTLFLSLIIGGMLAGIAGAVEVIGVHYRLVEGFELTGGANYASLGILVALACNGDPIGLPIVAFLMAALLIGGGAMQQTMGVPVEIIFIAQVTIVLVLLVVRKVKLGHIL